ncbi:hypothetical protein B4100_1529 [Heyndrickxia coagulans]|nr:hypothetical protein B4100_1529 [Heyndrickxia coagulans]
MGRKGGWAEFDGTRNWSAAGQFLWVQPHCKGISAAAFW